MPRVEVEGVPGWVPHEHLLGPGAWRAAGGAWVAELSREAAADLQARLRGVGLGGAKLRVRVMPSLKRALVRAARTEDARRRRTSSVGFHRSGTRLDDEGRMSLTPEGLALAIGQQAAGRPVVDATCGSGGNAIGFARAGCEVVAVDVDARRLEDAAHNARRYGVASRIRFVHGDARVVVPATPGLVFVDPPWGADWSRERTGLVDVPLLAELLAVVGSREVWAKVPPSFDPAEMADAVPEAWFGEAEGDARRVKFVLLRQGFVTHGSADHRPPR